MAYIVRSKVNPKLVLCTNGEFEPEDLIGPVNLNPRTGHLIRGYTAKVYKTRRGAEKVRNGEMIIVEECR